MIEFRQKFIEGAMQGYQWAIVNHYMINTLCIFKFKDNSNIIFFALFMIISIIRYQ